MNSIAGKTILLVEDEVLIGLMAADMLEQLGARVIGPENSLKAGMHAATVANLDAAVLDVNIRDERIDPVASALRKRGIPLVFATGYGDSISGLATGAPVIEKPYTQDRLAAALHAALAGQLFATGK